MTISEKEFADWLQRYGAAWQALDAKGLANMFAEDGLYYWNPFDDPKRGRAEMEASFKERTEFRKEPIFGARILYTQAQLGVAHWSFASTTNDKRVHLDGICVVQFNEAGKAASFRQWWHSDEGR